MADGLRMLNERCSVHWVHMEEGSGDEKRRLGFVPTTATRGKGKAATVEGSTEPCDNVLDVPEEDGR